MQTAAEAGQPVHATASARAGMDTREHNSEQIPHPLPSAYSEYRTTHGGPVNVSGPVHVHGDLHVHPPGSSGLADSLALPAEAWRNLLSELFAILKDAEYLSVRPRLLRPPACESSPSGRVLPS